MMKGVDEFIGRVQWEEKEAGGQPLRVKVGFDPTAPDLHLGHLLLLQKCRYFQDQGHHILFLIGDFTATIGDPTGKQQLRPVLSQEKIAENAKTYCDQVFKILLPEKTEVLFNSEWFSQMTAADLIQLSFQYTVTRMLERDDFSKRFHAQQSIVIAEFLYPLLQGHDSVVLKADLELGGSDQKFNLLMGRTLQKQVGQEPQAVMLLPLLEGLDGVLKMSKSLGNYIALQDPPKEIYGKVMSVSDTLMWRYFDLLSARTETEIQRLREQVAAGDNPKHIKQLLALELTALLHSASEAEKAAEDFEQQFTQKRFLEDSPVFSFEAGSEGLGLVAVLKECALITGTTQGFRLIEQGGVRIDGERVLERHTTLKAGVSYTLQVGKKKQAIAQIALKSSC
jgi:tyrosyl-tRNA synthetase